MQPLTVKELREVLEGVPDDVLVSYERIEDVYFDKHGWESEKVPDLSTPGLPDEYVQAEVAWYDKTKLRISAHY